MRKLIAATLAGALSLALVSPAALANEAEAVATAEAKSRFEIQFKDWQRGFWGNEALSRMVTKGVIKGNDDGTVAAVRPVSRLEAAIMVSRLLALKAPEIPQADITVPAPGGEITVENTAGQFDVTVTTPQGEVEFEDDADVPTWGRDAVLTALTNGFLIFDGARMSPKAPLNRLEAAIMLVKAGGLDAEAKAKAGAELSFRDGAKIAAGLRGYLAIAVEKGFVNGYEDGTFMPHKLVTRAEWAALLDRLDRQESPEVSQDGRQVRGTVSAVVTGDAPSITVSNSVAPNGVTYPFDAGAVFYEKGKAITLADVAAGDSVMINLSAEGKVLMVTVHNLPVHTTGAVKAYTAPTESAAGSLTVTVDGADKDFPVAANTPVALGEEAGTLADIQVGATVKVTTLGAEVSRIVVQTPAAADPAPANPAPATVTGQVVAVTAPAAEGGVYTLGIMVNNTLETYTLPAAATLKLGAEALAAADLKTGDQVEFSHENFVVTTLTVTGRTQ